jgi:hypothetical protein
VKLEGAFSEREFSEVGRVFLTEAEVVFSLLLWICKVTDKYGMVCAYGSVKNS